MQTLQQAMIKALGSNAIRQAMDEADKPSRLHDYYNELMLQAETEDQQPSE